MTFYFSIAFKNIFRDRRRSFTLGVNYFFVALLLLLVFAITEGMKRNISDSVIASSAGHITISGENIVKGRTYQGIRDFPRITAVIKETFPDAQVLTRYSLTSAVYYKNLSKRLSFVGIDPALDPGLRGQIDVQQGSWDDFAAQPGAVIMPRGVMDYFGLAKDDDLLIATRTHLGAFNTGTIQVRGVYTTGNYFLRNLVIGHFNFLQSLDLADKVTASKMFIFFPTLRGVDAKRDQLVSKLTAAGFVATKPASSNDALNAVAAASPRYKVLGEDVNQIRLTLSTADEVTGIVSQAVGAVNGVGLFVAAIMLFIISVSIFINMRMTITDRMQEIGTLRAMGAEQRDVVALFITENVFLCILFVCLGIAAGLAVVGGASLVTLPSDSVLGLALNKGHFVLKPTLSSILFILGSLTVFTAVFSYFPARYGGRIPAVVALNKTN